MRLFKLIKCCIMCLACVKLPIICLLAIYHQRTTKKTENNKQIRGNYAYKRLKHKYIDLSFGDGRLQIVLAYVLN